MNGVLEKAKTTTSLIKLNILNRNTQKVTAEVSFGLKIHFKDLKKKKVYSIWSTFIFSRSKTIPCDMM